MWLSDYIGKPLQLHTFLKDMSSWMAFGSGRTSFLIEVKPRDESSSKSRHSRAGPWLRLRNVWHAGINDYEHLATLGVSPQPLPRFQLRLLRCVRLYRFWNFWWPATLLSAYVTSESDENVSRGDNFENPNIFSLRVIQGMELWVSKGRLSRLHGTWATTS